MPIPKYSAASLIERVYFSFIGILFISNPSRICLPHNTQSKVSLDELCKQMAKVPDWMPDILLKADGYTTPFYKKD
jgi:hypothetical protein